MKQKHPAFQVSAWSEGGRGIRTVIQHDMKDRWSCAHTELHAGHRVRVHPGDDEHGQVPSYEARSRDYGDCTGSIADRRRQHPIPLFPGAATYAPLRTQTTAEKAVNTPYQTRVGWKLTRIKDVSASSAVRCS